MKEDDYSSFCDFVNGYPTCIRKEVAVEVLEWINKRVFAKPYHRRCKEEYLKGVHLDVDGKFVIRTTVPYLNSRQLRECFNRALTTVTEGAGYNLNEEIEAIRDALYAVEPYCTHDASIDYVRGWCKTFLLAHPEAVKKDA